MLIVHGKIAARPWVALTQQKPHGDAEEGDAGGLGAQQAAPADQAGPDDGRGALAQPPADHGHERGWNGKQKEESGAEGAKRCFAGFGDLYWGHCIRCPIPGATRGGTE